MMISLMPSRAALDKVLALGGLLLVVVEIYTHAYAPGHILLLALGILMMYVGSWRLIGGLVHKRANERLRGEIDNFITLVRRLYSYRSEGDSARIHETKTALRESVERIISNAITLREQV